MDKPSPELRRLLDSLVHHGQRDELGSRGSSFDETGGAIYGRPRATSKRHAAMRKAAYGPKSKFDSFNTGDGQASEKGEFAKRLAAIDATLGPPVIPLK